jgi:hypothetical protein
MLVRDSMTGMFDWSVTAVMGTAVGQVVGTVTEVRRARRVMEELVEGFIEAATRLAGLLEFE